MQDPGRAIAADHFGRTIKAAKKWSLKPWFGSALYSRIHSTSSRFASSLPKPWLKPISCKASYESGPRPAIYSFTERSGKTALDCDGAVAMCLHQALEEQVAENQNVLAPMERFSKAKQLHRITKRGHDPVHRGVEDFGRINGERNRLALNPIV